jgi:hypothetical protein
LKSGLGGEHTESNHRLMLHLGVRTAEAKFYLALAEESSAYETLNWAGPALFVELLLHPCPCCKPILLAVPDRPFPNIATGSKQFMPRGWSFAACDIIGEVGRR